MRFFRIPNFTGIEAHRDDADRGTLRRCEGCIPSGPGGLRSGPVWSTVKKLGADIAFSPPSDASSKASALFGGNFAIVSVGRSGKIHDLKVWHAGNDKLDDTILTATGDIAASTPRYPASAGAGYSHPARLSQVGDRMLALADGGDDPIRLLQYFPTGGSLSMTPDFWPDNIDGSVKILEIKSSANIIGNDSNTWTNSGSTFSRPSSYFHMENSDFPNCTMFVVGPNKALYAAGDIENPLTVYVSEPAGLTSSEGDRVRKDGDASGILPGTAGYESSVLATGYRAHFRSSRDSLYSTGALGKVDLLMTNASKITALSCLGNQVVVHTDAGAHLLYAPSPDQAESGYRVEQAPSSVAAAAVNQSVVGGGGGSQNLYLGYDGQIYKDEATARGSENKPAYSDPNQASWKSKGRWDDEHPGDLSNSFSAYEPGMGQYWVFMENNDYLASTSASGSVTEGTFTGITRMPRFNGWCFDELTDTLSGPFTNSQATAITPIPNTTQLLAVMGDDRNVAASTHLAISTDLKDLREGDFEAPPTLWADTSAMPTGVNSTTGTTDFVVANSEAVPSFSYRGRYYASPFADSVSTSATIPSAKFFDAAHLAVVETAWMHLGNEHDEKQVHRVDLSFRKNSAGRLWLYVESDEGKVSGQYKGAIQEHVKVFTNLRGRRFRVRMFIVTHHLYPWNLREMAIGHLMGKSF